MKITGTSGKVTFDFENGYKTKADGEFLIGNRFFVYINTIQEWEPPHEHEKLSREHVRTIMEEINKNNAVEGNLKLEYEENEDGRRSKRQR